MNDARQMYRIKCLEFFKGRYGRRVQDYRLTAYDIPSSSTCSIDPLLPYLLNDKPFYQGRLYVSNSTGFKIADALWEAMGMSPGDYTVLLDMVSNPKGTFWAMYHDDAFLNTTHPRFRDGMSLAELFGALNNWPKRDQDIAHRNIVAALQTYSHFLLGQFYGELC
jgi:hypothetical protein